MSLDARNKYRIQRALKNFVRAPLEYRPQQMRQIRRCKHFLQ
jgi:hypothetical protein